MCEYIYICVQVFLVIDELDRDFDESRSMQLVSWCISAVGASCSWFMPMGGSNRDTESSSTRGSTGSHGDYSDRFELWRDKRLSLSHRYPSRGRKNWESTYNCQSNSTNMLTPSPCALNHSETIAQNQARKNAGSKHLAHGSARTSWNGAQKAPGSHQ